LTWKTIEEISREQRSGVEWRNQIYIVLC